MVNLGAGKIQTQIDAGNYIRSLTVGTGLTTSNTATEINTSVDTANLDAGTLGVMASYFNSKQNLVVGPIASKNKSDVFSEAEYNT